MNLHEFLHFNRKCPICDEPLNLYMQWVNSVCFEAKQLDEQAYYFKPFKGLGKDSPEGDSLKDEYVILQDGETTESIFSNGRIKEESKKYQVYFFFVCNPAGFKDKGYRDYELNLFKCCYYRSSPFFEYKQKPDGKWELEHTLPETKDIVTHDESLCFKHLGKDNERVYMLNLNYDKKETKLWHYIVPETEKNKKGYQPKLFSKVLPILTNRPDFGFDAREKLLDRFDSWIIMS